MLKNNDARSPGRAWDQPWALPMGSERSCGSSTMPTVSVEPWPVATSNVVTRSGDGMCGLGRVGVKTTRSRALRAEDTTVQL